MPAMKLHAKYLALLGHATSVGRANIDDLRLCFELLSLADAIDQDCAVRLAPYGLSEGKFVVLLLLSDAPDGLSPFELAERTGVTRATTTGLLGGLERDGYITRRGTRDDGRRINVRLTPKGKEVGKKLSTEHTAWIAGLFAGVTPAGRRGLRRAFHDVWAATDVGARQSADGKDHAAL